MRAYLISLGKYTLAGAGLGAVAGLLMAAGRPEGLPAGAFIGAMLGWSIVALRSDRARLMSKSHARLKSTPEEAASGFTSDKISEH